MLKTGSLNRTSAGINLSPSFFNNHLKIDINLKGSKSDSRFANEGAIGAAVNFMQSYGLKDSEIQTFHICLDIREFLHNQYPKYPLRLISQNSNHG